MYVEFWLSFVAFLATKLTFGFGFRKKIESSVSVRQRINMKRGISAMVAEEEADF